MIMVKSSLLKHIKCICNLCNLAVPSVFPFLFFISVTSPSPPALIGLGLSIYLSDFLSPGINPGKLPV